MSSCRLVGLFAGSPKGSRGNKHTWLPGMAASQTYKGRHKEVFWSASFSNYDLFLSRLSLGFACQAAIFFVSIWTEARNEWQIVSTILSNISFFYTWWADKMVYWAMKLEKTVNSIMTFTPCRWEANAENGIGMTVLRVSDDKNLIIFVPLSGLDIAGVLLLKYCISLYFSFLEKYYWLKNNLSLSLSSKNKHIYIASFHLLLLLSILLLISYIIYNKRYKKNMYPFLQLRLRLETGRITWFPISSLRGQRPSPCL